MLKKMLNYILSPYIMSGLYIGYILYFVDFKLGLVTAVILSGLISWGMYIGHYSEDLK